MFHQRYHTHNIWSPVGRDASRMIGLILALLLTIALSQVPVPIPVDQTLFTMSITTTQHSQTVHIHVDLNITNKHQSKVVHCSVWQDLSIWIFIGSGTQYPQGKNSISRRRKMTEEKILHSRKRSQYIL